MTELNNIFCKMADSRAVVQFVREIQKHPCLYDQKSLEYGNRALKRKTWIHIAKKSNCSVPECKEKWRKIRIAYIRTLKPVYQNGIRVYTRPYYLASYLKFISPYKKPVPNDNNHSSTSEDKGQVEVPNETEMNKDDGSDDSNDQDKQDRNPKHQMFLDIENECFDDSEEVIDDCNNIEVEDSKETVLVEVNKMNEVKYIGNHNSGKIEKRKSCCGSIECNPRKMFLLSILPDIEALTEQQMRTFRREVIGLVDKLLYE